MLDAGAALGDWLRAQADQTPDLAADETAV